ncbi:energy transducer TonB [Sulfurimonas sp. HSL-1656]|uniref:energy transducer TonB n=1 Tax=Thiomicrolovo subterrani TaxID=3131934 RepID=UPI0031FA4239
MIHENDHRHRLLAMGASVLMHGALLGAFLYAPRPVLPAPAAERQTVAISLAAYTPRAASPAAAAAPQAKPLPAKPAARPKSAVKSAPKPAPVTAKPAPVTLPIPQHKTPEIKASDDASLSEAFASLPSPPVAPASHAETSPHTPDNASSATPLANNNKKADPTGPDATVLGRIRAMIESAITYPAAARRLRLEGVVTLSFKLASDGTVATAEVLRSSGSTVLDRKALQTLWDLSGDFPSLESLTHLTIPITFSLSHS